MHRPLASLLFMSVISPALAQEDTVFHQVELTAPHPIIAEPYFPKLLSKDRKALALLGKDEKRRFFFSIYEQLDGDAQSIAVPEEALFFDFLSDGEGEKAHLVFLTKDGVAFVDPENGEANLVLKTQSIYRLASNPNFSHLDFARDLNGDGRDDVIVQDFDGYHLFIHTEAGFQDPVFLPFPVEMRIGGAPYYDASAPRYESFPIYSLDMTLDERDDVAFLKDKTLYVFEQSPDGSFSEQAQIIDIPIDIIGNSMSEFLRSEETSTNRANFTERRISNIQDIDGDKIPDILTLEEEAKGTFDRKTTYGVHFGRQTPQGLSFNEEADTVSAIKGFSLFQSLSDVEGDGRFENITATNDIGLGKIVSALLTGSTKFDLSIFKINDQRQFEEKPNLVKKIRLDFDFSSGNISIPAVKLADLDGDGRKELILDDEKKGIRIFSQDPKRDEIFGRKAKDYEVQLPQDGQFVQVEDIDENGRDDLIIHFDPFGADGEENRNRLIFLLSL